ncbi:ABC transporter substrate-binding protein [Actinorhabdospora filicis]|uniref:ABC transporter substrate-binding protein n=1 Tax=Actinorhabdospora filicis TaxID=1785913 RepID=A0A9W6SJG8_9ACTN|nr:ABC transporter substrate-binding protein [Actinorhabdospora filicis]GLZ76756.1 ABC transporter substrate-binding protein [Actinorhabdospora filicis]
MTLPRLRSALALSTVALVALTACNAEDAGDGGKVTIGFVASLSGTYQTVGEDMRDGFQLYLDTHGGKLGGRTVDLVVADEGDGPQTALPAATRLVQEDEVDALAGVVAGGSYAAIANLAQENKIPLVGANARPDMKSTDWLWHTSYISDEPGIAIAPYVKENVAGPVYAIGPDYQGGHDELRGFVDTYTKLGGVLANPDGKTRWTPFPGTSDFLPYLNEIAQTNAKAVYCFYAGKAAVDFVKQYAQSDVADLPLYGAFLTEGAILDAQGDSAKGIRNVLNYSPDLDNPANRTFVAEWSARHDRQPTTFAMASYDAAAVLDRAIAAVPAGQDVSPELINNAIGALGTIDSPRGPWQFSPKTHSPIQRWYLREVALDGTKLSNLLVEDLATVGG